ncbi:MAG: hypothetical protein ACE5KT_03030 [Methanosarcinales archaeon]
MAYWIATNWERGISIAVEMGDEVDFIVTDDRLAYIVIDRMGIKKVLFLDLIIELVERSFMDLELAKSIINVIESRYHEGFIYHTLKILESGDRKGLK